MSVRIQRDYGRFTASVNRKIDQSYIDIVDVARRNLGGGSLSRTVGVAKHAGGARVGSNHPGAKAQEVGAYITPKKGKVLRFRDGSFRRSARIRGKKWLARAGRQWPDKLRQRLREVR